DPGRGLERPGLGGRVDRGRLGGGLGCGSGSRRGGSRRGGAVVEDRELVLAHRADAIRAQAGRRPSTYRRSVVSSCWGPRWYHSTSVSPAVPNASITAFGSCSTKSWFTGTPNHSASRLVSAPACSPTASQ